MECNEFKERVSYQWAVCLLLIIAILLAHSWIHYTTESLIKENVTKRMDVTPASASYFGSLGFESHPG